MRRAKCAVKQQLKHAWQLEDDDALRWANTSGMRSRLEAAIILAQSEIALSDSGKNWNVETTKQCVFLCYGNGANGKSTFLEALRYTLGDYAHNIPFSTLELEGRTSIPNDVAGLVGRRFVTAIETNDSVRLNEARLKALTGCDAISARHLYQDFFTFVPVAKFWLAFNHKPVVQDNSHALWRRLKPIPFTQTFEAGTEDKNLLATLKKEAKGILSWAVEGFRLYQVEGLDEPTAVTIPY